MMVWSGYNVYCKMCGNEYCKILCECVKLVALDHMGQPWPQSYTFMEVRFCFSHLPFLGCIIRDCFMNMASSRLCIIMVMHGKETVL